MKWALVTGGAKRLGAAVAREAAARGWSIVIHHLNSGREAEALASALSAAHGVRCVALKGDLAEEANAIVPRAAALAGAPLTALVNSASIFEHDLIGTLDAISFERHMRVNALAPSLLMQAFAQQLPGDARGAVVNFLDFKIAAPYPDHFTYTLSKFALSGATELGARALAPRIRVNAVAPGYVLPSPGQSAADFARLHDQTPLERGTTPEDVACAVLFLIESEAITGQTLYLDSGLRFAPHQTDFMFR